MLLDDQESQLVLVDYQARLMPAIFEADLVLANAMRLAQAAHWMEVPTYGTEQNPDKLGQNPADLRALCRRTISKMSFSACPDGLSELLRPQHGHLLATPAACPSICKRPFRKSPHVRALLLPVVKPMCACCKPLWIYWKRNIQCGW